ncbi:FHA domain-containing protein [bacterium]|nr:FHA domain-containing protein [bacterium]
MENIPSFRNPNTLVRWQPRVVKTGSVIVIYSIPPDNQGNGFLTVGDITFALSSKITYIGRNQSNNFCLRGDMYISNNHARIFYEDKNYYIIDDSSTNGTFLNRNPLYKGEKYILTDGSEIQFGVNTVTKYTKFSA